MKTKGSVRIPDNIREQVKILAIEGLSERTISNRLGISNNAVHRIKGEIDNLEQFRADKKRKIAEKYWEKVILALDLVTKGKLNKLSAHQLMVSAAIGTDKAQLLTGGATEILGVKTEKELDKELKELQVAERELNEAWERAQKKKAEAEAKAKAEAKAEAKAKDGKINS
ncbi:hypothetical protein ES705_06488 [subsurface metagenome]|nr:hypothetical protein [Clostridia bacterium]